MFDFLDDSAIERLRRPLREEKPVASVPHAAFESDTLRERDRFRQFALLSSVAADRNGVAYINGGLAYLEKGCLLATLSSLGQLWGVSKSSARRSLDAMRRAKLVGVHDTLQATCADTEESPPIAKGKIFAVRGLARDPLVNETV